MGLSRCLFVSLFLPSLPDSQHGVASGSVMECRLQTFTQGQAQTPDLSEGTRGTALQTQAWEGRKSCVGVIVQLWFHSSCFQLLLVLIDTVRVMVLKFTQKYEGKNIQSLMLTSSAPLDGTVLFQYHLDTIVVFIFLFFLCVQMLL